MRFPVAMILWNVSCRGSCRDFQLFKVLDEYFGNGLDTGAPGGGIATLEPAQQLFETLRNPSTILK